MTIKLSHACLLLSCLIASAALAFNSALAAPTASTPYLLCAYKGKLTVRSKCPLGARRVGRLSDLIGQQGPQGIPGPVTSMLPSGITMRGFYSSSSYASGSGSVKYGAISFGFTLSSHPTAHYIAVGETAPAECPGNVGQPEAAAGHLCVYEDGRSQYVSYATVTTTAGENTSAAFGALVSIVPVSTPASGAHEVYTHGTWAVTAP